MGPFGDPTAAPSYHRQYEKSATSPRVLLGFDWVLNSENRRSAVSGYSAVLDRTIYQYRATKRDGGHCVRFAFHAMLRLAQLHWRAGICLGHVACDLFALRFQGHQSVTISRISL